MFEKEIVIDGKGHLIGRLASILAKELLNGQRVVVVRTEKINVSGSLYRNKVKFMEFLRKKMVHNPWRGAQHYRSPARQLWRAVRGMLPHKTDRGANALGRFKAFEGIPAPYDTKKRQVVPAALKVLRLKNYRKFCVLGELCQEVGWKRQDLIEKLEAKRKERSKNFFTRKLNVLKKRRQATNHADFKDLRERLSKLGY